MSAELRFAQRRLTRSRVCGATLLFKFATVANLRFSGLTLVFVERP